MKTKIITIASCVPHWQEGVLNLVGIGVEELVAELADMNPEWRKYIMYDPAGKIKLHDRDGRTGTGGTAHIIIPGPGNPNFDKAPGVRGKDLGLRMDQKGKWSVLKGAWENSPLDNIDKEIADRIATRKIKDEAVKKGDKYVGETIDEDTGRLKMRFVSNIKKRKHELEI